MDDGMLITDSSKPFPEPRQSAQLREEFLLLEEDLLVAFVYVNNFRGMLDLPLMPLETLQEMLLSPEALHPQLRDIYIALLAALLDDLSSSGPAEASVGGSMGSLWCLQQCSVLCSSDSSAQGNSAYLPTHLLDLTGV